MPQDLTDSMNQIESADDENIIDETGSDEGSLGLPENQREAVMRQRDTSLFEYHRLYQEGRLKLNPDWQRDYVWKGKRPSLLIESLLMRIPIPVIFMSRTADWPAAGFVDTELRWFCMKPENRNAKTKI